MLGSVLARAFWAMLPAYVPNNVAVLLGGGAPIDGGRSLGGERVLGDGKTWQGTVAGTVAGTALALLLNAVSPVIEDRTGVLLPRFSLRAGFSLAFGAMLGDVGASFLKRRTGRERGAAFPGLDQLDFVVGSLGLSSLLAGEWFEGTFRAPVVAAVVVMTPLLHVVTNAGAYVLGLKDEPW